ncbi:hypothetical protein ACXYMU_07950 [Pontibacter sp. CAU 1760]
MALSPKLLAVLDKSYAPKERYDQKFLGKDITFVTDAYGDPATLFIGKRRADGSIAGERYVRRVVRDPASQVIQKSHWENKGKVSRG